MLWGNWVVEYRGHLTRWHILKVAALMAFGTGVCLYNLFLIWRGLTTGAVKSLRRRSNELVYLDSDPGWFGFNLCVRSLLALVFAAAVIFLWRKLQKERAAGVPD